MAKITIEIPDRFIDATKGIMVMQADGEQEAQQMEKVADLLKQAEEPIVLDTTSTGIFGGDEKGCKEFYLAVCAFAFAQIIKNKKMK